MSYLTDSPVVPSSFAIWGIDGMNVPEVKTGETISRESIGSGEELTRNQTSPGNDRYNELFLFR